MALNPDPIYQIKQYSETPLADFLNEMGETREPFTNPEPKTEVTSPETPVASSAEPGTVIPPVTEPAPVVVLDPKEIQTKRDFTAKMLAKYTDKGFAFLCAIIAEDEDLETYQADKEDMCDLQEVYFEMCVGYGWVNMPPWLNLVFCISFTYGPKVKDAFKDRKINKEIARKALQAQADQALAEQKYEDALAEIKRLKSVGADPSADVQPENKKTTNPDGNEPPAK